MWWISDGHLSTCIAAPTVKSALGQAATSLAAQPWSAVEWIADAQLARPSVSFGLRLPVAGILKAMHLTSSERGDTAIVIRLPKVTCVLGRALLYSAADKRISAGLVICRGAGPRGIDCATLRAIARRRGEPRQDRDDHRSSAVPANRGYRPSAARVRAPSSTHGPRHAAHSCLAFRYSAPRVDARWGRVWRKKRKRIAPILPL